MDAFSRLSGYAQLGGQDLWVQRAQTSLSRQEPRTCVVHVCGVHRDDTLQTCPGIRGIYPLLSVYA